MLTQEDFDKWFQKTKDTGRQLSRTEFHLARAYGARKGDCAPIEAFEFGYQCPTGHLNVVWSEFNEHIWCPVCKCDILTRKCPIQKQDWMSQEKFCKFIENLPFKAIIKS